MVYRYVARDWSPEASQAEYCAFTHLPRADVSPMGFFWQTRKGVWKALGTIEASTLAGRDLPPGGIERLLRGLKVQGNEMLALDAALRALEGEEQETKP